MIYCLGTFSPNLSSLEKIQWTVLAVQRSVLAVQWSVPSRSVIGEAEVQVQERRTFPNRNRNQNRHRNLCTRLRTDTIELADQGFETEATGSHHNETRFWLKQKVYLSVFFRASTAYAFKNHSPRRNGTNWDRQSRSFHVCGWRLSSRERRLRLSLHKLVGTKTSNV